MMQTGFSMAMRGMSAFASDMKNDTAAWVGAGSLPPSTTQVDISSVTGGQTYYAAVTYVVDGEPGDRLVLGPVTIGEISIGPRRFDTTTITFDSTLETMDLA